MEPLYTYLDYKKYLADRIEENEAVRGYKAMLADAAQCQRSFMSQVLNTHVHLTPDHAVGLADFWKFDGAETEYFLEMVHLARAATPSLRSHLEGRLRVLASRQRDAVARIEHPALEEIEHQSIYYSHWYWSALHMLVGTKGPHTEKSLAEKINMPVPLVRQALTMLESMRLIEKSKAGWAATRRHLHAPSDSIYSWLHHGSWRNRANEMMRQHQDGSIHFTAVYSLSEKDIERIGDFVLKLMSDTNKTVEPSPEEEVACLCVDWFRV